MTNTKLALIGAILVVGGSCGNDGSGPEASELAGTWRATRFEYVSVANSNQRLELVALGAVVTVTLTEAGAFTIVVAIPDEPQETFTGTWSASRDVLTLNRASGGGQWQFDMQLSGNTLTLSDANSEFDINGDDQDEPVKLNMTLARQ